MVDNSGASGARNDILLDLAGLVLIAFVALVCAALALAGYPPAGQSLPYLVGALVGDGLVVLAIRTPRFRKALVVLAISLVAASAILRFDRRYGDTGLLPVGLPWEVPVVVDKLSIGLLFGFGGFILWLIVDPVMLGGPRSWEEAVGQRRDLVHKTLVVGGILLALVVLAALVFGGLALLAYVVGDFSSR